MKSYDIIVIGGGIAGISVAAHLAADKRVVVLEMEERPGYHSTGRSAASFEPNYGPSSMLAFTRASEHFFREPPKGFSDAALIIDRDSLFVMPQGQEEAAERLLSKADKLAEISVRAAQEFFPVLRSDYAKRVFLDPNTGDLDVDLIHRGYLRLFRERGGEVLANHQVKGLLRRDWQWQIATEHGIFTSPIVVNAAGAWGDFVAKLGGVKPVGLQPKRRSIGVVPVDGEEDFMDWPMVTDVGETWYCKPQSGKLIVSSADATPVDPHDAYADDMAIAEGIERLMIATTLDINRLDHSWGGLRSFVADGSPVVGFAPDQEGFFWLVGQGGYGIQSSPALSETAAALILDKPLPVSVIANGLELADIAPRSFHP
ncbi:MAG: FAD-binding oxidoreductase [Phyllobacteriaceae bacterium]|nr:FAD-binding oxidoreductase [Phyllobacteriaceae bacterium]